MPRSYTEEMLWRWCHQRGTLHSEQSFYSCLLSVNLCLNLWGSLRSGCQCLPAGLANHRFQLKVAAALILHSLVDANRLFSHSAGQVWMGMRRNRVHMVPYSTQTSFRGGCEASINRSKLSHLWSWLSLKQMNFLRLWYCTLNYELKHERC